MIKISHPLPSTSACSLAAVWCGIAMETLLFPTQRKQNNRYWQHFLCFPSSTPHLSSLPCIQSCSVLVRSITLSFSLPLPTYCSFHLSHLSLSLSPVSYYMVLPHSLLNASPLLLPTHSISSILERKKNWGKCTCWFWHMVCIPCR